MSVEPKKILISRALLNKLKSDHRLKAAIKPDANEQRITCLIAPSDNVRVFESKMYNRHSVLTDPPCMVVISLGSADIAHIQKVHAFLVETNSLSTMVSAKAFKSSKFYYAGEGSNEMMTHVAMRINVHYFEQRFTNGLTDDEMLSEDIAVPLLFCQYHDSELLGLNELLTSEYQVFAVEDNGDESELNAASRKGITYSVDNEHPEFTLNTWRRAVTHNDTLLGYSDWVHEQIEIACIAARVIESCYS